ncbi:MAG: SRPBCC family protein [Acidobacteriaceae bacterium]
MTLKIIGVLLVIVVAVLLFAATRAGTIRVERSISIEAPAQKIFPLINDLHNWERWAPQDTEDPMMHRTYSGMTSGAGAVSQWHGFGSTGC